MISSKLFNSNFLFPASLILVLTACGGGGAGGGSTNNSGDGGGFSASNTNTKPQASSDSSTNASNASVSSINSADSNPGPQSNKSSTSSSSKPSQPASSSSSKLGPNGNNNSTLDKTPPTIPYGFVASSFSDVIFLEWEQSEDNVGVTSYKLYRDGIQIAENWGNDEKYYADYNVAKGKTYTYSLSAGDAAGNWSQLIALTAAATISSQSSSSSSRSANTSSSSSTIQSSSSSSSKSVTTSSSSSIPSQSSSRAASTSSSSSSSSKSSSSSSQNVVIGVFLQWQRPAFRENGEDFYEHELGGYEIRYKLPGSTNYTAVKIQPTMTTHSLGEVTNNNEFEIASFDASGLYSRFVTITPE